MKKEVSFLAIIVVFALMLMGCIEPRFRRQCEMHPMPVGYCRFSTGSKGMNALLACDCCDGDKKGEPPADKPADNNGNQGAESQDEQQKKQQGNSVVVNQAKRTGNLIHRSNFWSTHLNFAQGRK